MNDAIQYLIDIAQQMSIRIEWCNSFDQYTPPASSTKYHSIVMNTNWHKPKEIVFQLAHEISHIINHDDCEIAFYHASFSSHELIEKEANIGAIRLLLHIYKETTNNINIVDFMGKFSIPNYLLDNVYKIMKSGN